ncbi:hypothetical protein SNEBB_004897 [Seison nebaliae]|nr:hypothetical protein SNEBB_004897 [Seison nebaliae]
MSQNGWKNSIEKLVWLKDGRDKNELENEFEQWSQGFTFSEFEKTALIQEMGGPCGVIVPVQAEMIYHLLFAPQPLSDEMTWRNYDNRNSILTLALYEILIRASSEENKFRLVRMNRSTIEEIDMKMDKEEEDMFSEEMIGLKDDSDEIVMITKKEKKSMLTLTSGQFHELLEIESIESREELKKYLETHLNQYLERYGIILFLYSVIMSRGIDVIEKDLISADQPILIDMYALANQSLINLMLIGEAVPYVWDDDKNLEGLILRGIPRRSKIGFLTMMEHHRLVEVGWKLKNPQFPIWILSSGDHLTLFFSTQLKLTKENERVKMLRLADQIFTQQEASPQCQFIMKEKLLVICNELGIYVDNLDRLYRELDRDDLGIISKNEFLRYFYPEAFAAIKATEMTNDDSIIAIEQVLNVEEEGTGTANIQRGDPLFGNLFHAFHYNGLKNSNFQKEVRYRECETQILDFSQSAKLVTKTTLMGNVLETKWATLFTKWKENIEPNIN